jgi:Cu(I)/Ag(I) efflux system membrane fusion protein
MLAAAEELPQALRDHAATVADRVAHLHHRSVGEAREQFKTISRSILLLASAARSQGASEPVMHYWCAMVPGGGGDWLQTAAPPTNPYQGRKMLRCVQHEQKLIAPAPQVASPPAPDES